MAQTISVITRDNVMAFKKLLEERALQTFVKRYAWEEQVGVSHPREQITIGGIRYDGRGNAVGFDNESPTPQGSDDQNETGQCHCQFSDEELSQLLSRSNRLNAD